MKINNFLSFAFFILVLSFASSILGMNFFLQEPEQLKSDSQPRTISMCWLGKNKESECRFVYNKKTGVYVNLFYKELPEFIDKEQEKLFEKIDGKYMGYNFVYSYGNAPKEENGGAQGQQDQAEGDNQECYYVGDVLEISDQKSKQMSVDEAVEYIKIKNVVFYTGAGISMASKVFNMSQLENALGFVGNDRFNAISFIKNLISKPEVSTQVFEKFCISMYDNPATEAHKALMELANYKKCKIVTENLDSLHQKTGIEPYEICGSKFKKEVKDEWAKEIDAIICCGLSHDDRGFLGWYKKNNPDGVIIAIDLAAPNYLSSKDFLLTGDVQKIIPEILCNLIAQLFS